MNGIIFAFFTVYLVVINILGFIIMLIDKARALQHHWRIPEKSLFFVAIVGGSVGTLCGMIFCRHKIRKLIFVIGLPIIMFIQLATILAVLF